MTKISVCIPTYNGAAYIADALRSVLAQTYDDFELIVCDDTSADDTLRIVETFHDDRLRVVRNPVRLGLVGNWNRCIDLASGGYIVLFHQDDLMYPNNLQRKVEFLDRHPDVGFVHSDIDCIDEAGKVVGGHWASQSADTGRISGESFFAAIANEGKNPVACPTVVARRHCYETTGYYDDRLPFAVDLEMWLRLAAKYPVGYIAERLVAHRLHIRQEGSRFRNTGRDAQDFLNALDITNASSIPLSCRQQIQQAYKTLSNQSIGMARWQAKLGHVDNTLRYLRIALLARIRVTFPISTNKYVKTSYI